jgi:hypothetical protein
LKRKKWQAAFEHQSCTKKHKYDTREEAETVAKIYKQTVYKCWYCGKYHLTKMTFDTFKEYMNKLIIKKKLSGKKKS